MTFIEILGYSGVAAGVVQAGPPSGFVSGTAKELPIDETFDGHNGMLPVRQPIIGKPRTAQGQGASGQIRQLVGVGQNAKAGIVGQQMAATGQLFLRPADPGIARAQVSGRGTPAEQR